MFMQHVEVVCMDDLLSFQVELQSWCGAASPHVNVFDIFSMVMESMQRALFHIIVNTQIGIIFWLMN